MRSNYVPFPKRVVSLLTVFLVVLFLLPVCHAGYPGEGEFRNSDFGRFHFLSDQEKEALASRIEWMSAEAFNELMEQAKSYWSEIEVQKFMDWLGKSPYLSSSCDQVERQLPTTFRLPKSVSWPANIPTLKQGNLMQCTQGSKTSAYVIGGTTRTTYEELKSRVEVGEWLLADEKGKKQIEKDVKNNMAPGTQTPEEFFAGLGIEMLDEAYYSRADDKGQLGMAFGGNTTMLIVTQKTPGNAVEEPYPTLYSPDMNAAQKKALVMTLLNMGREDLLKAINENMASLTTAEFIEFMACFDQELRALGDDVYEDFYSRMGLMLPTADE